MTRDNLSFVWDPFTAEVHTVPLDFQEILDLKNDLSVKALYKQSSLEKFWSGMLSAYPDVSSYAIRRLLPFASTYSSECGFSSLLNIKSKQRNCLEAQRKVIYVVSYLIPLLSKHLLAIYASKSLEAQHLQ